MRRLIAILLLLGFSAYAQSSPIYPYPFPYAPENPVYQYFCCSWNRIETYNYDSASDTFSYLAIGPAERHVPLSNSNSEFEFVDSIFSWSARVDENGHVTDPGSMLWFADLGRGYELLASGKVKSESVVIEELNPNPEEGSWGFANWDLEFENNYFSAPIAMGGLLHLELEIYVESKFDSPFKADFGCLVPEPQCKSHVSSTGLWSVRVSEPGSMGLALGLGIFSLAIARSRRFRHRACKSQN